MEEKLTLFKSEYDSRISTAVRFGLCVGVILSGVVVLSQKNKTDNIKALGQAFIGVGIIGGALSYVFRQIDKMPETEVEESEIEKK